MGVPRSWRVIRRSGVWDQQRQSLDHALRHRRLARQCGPSEHGLERAHGVAAYGRAQPRREAPEHERLEHQPDATGLQHRLLAATVVVAPENSAAARQHGLPLAESAHRTRHHAHEAGAQHRLAQLRAQQLALATQTVRSLQGACEQVAARGSPALLKRELADGAVGLLPSRGRAPSRRRSPQPPSPVAHPQGPSQYPTTPVCSE